MSDIPLGDYDPDLRILVHRDPWEPTTFCRIEPDPNRDGRDVLRFDEDGEPCALVVEYEGRKFLLRLEAEEVA